MKRADERQWHYEHPVDSVGYRIRIGRYKAGMSLDDLSQRAELSKSFLSELENGRRGTLSIRNAMKVCEVLGISIQWLAYGHGQVKGAKK